MPRPTEILAACGEKTVKLQSKRFTEGIAQGQRQGRFQAACTGATA